MSALVAVGERPGINVVAPDGFEPPLPEPESGVLPLHQGAMSAEAKPPFFCDEGGTRTHNLVFRGHLL